MEPIPVATLIARAYSPAMVALRLLRVMTLFALLLAPFGMMRSHAAMVLPAASVAPGHHMDPAAPADPCPGMDQPAEDRPASNVDCMIACSAMPSLESGIAIHPILAATMPRPSPAGVLHGLHPESDPPPPRFA
jgi:hypothetical protein